MNSEMHQLIQQEIAKAVQQALEHRPPPPQTPSISSSRTFTPQPLSGSQDSSAITPSSNRTQTSDPNNTIDLTNLPDQYQPGSLASHRPLPSHQGFGRHRAPLSGQSAARLQGFGTTGQTVYQRGGKVVPHKVRGPLVKSKSVTFGARQRVLYIPSPRFVHPIPRSCAGLYKSIGLGRNPFKSDWTYIYDLCEYLGYECQPDVTTIDDGPTVEEKIRQAFREKVDLDGYTFRWAILSRDRKFLVDRGGADGMNGHQLEKAFNSQDKTPCAFIYLSDEDSTFVDAFRTGSWIEDEDYSSSEEPLEGKVKHEVSITSTQPFEHKVKVRSSPVRRRASTPKRSHPRNQTSPDVIILSDNESSTPVKLARSKRTSVQDKPRSVTPLTPTQLRKKRGRSSSDIQWDPVQRRKGARTTRTSQSAAEFAKSSSTCTNDDSNLSHDIGRLSSISEDDEAGTLDKVYQLSGRSVNDSFNHTTASLSDVEPQLQSAVDERVENNGRQDDEVSVYSRDAAAAAAIRRIAEGQSTLSDRGPRRSARIGSIGPK